MSSGRKGSASKIQLNSFDDLFGFGNEIKQETSTSEQVMEIALDDLHTFKNHPFRVLDDAKLCICIVPVGKPTVVHGNTFKFRKNAALFHTIKTTFWTDIQIGIFTV